MFLLTQHLSLVLVSVILVLIALLIQVMSPLNPKP